MDDSDDDDVRRQDAQWAQRAEESLAEARSMAAPAAAGSSRAPGKAPGPRPIGAPRRNYVGYLGGLGLLGLLISVAIMALMWSRAAEEVTTVAPGIERGATSVDRSAGAPAALPDEADDATAGSATVQGPPSAVDCMVERRTLETALMAYEVDTGAAAMSLAAVVQHGFLVEGTEFRYELRADESLVGTGDCTGL